MKFLRQFRKLFPKSSSGKAGAFEPSGAARGRSAHRGPDAVRHAVTDTYQNASGQQIIKIAEEQSVSIFTDGADSGYHDFGTRWWFNPDCPYAFQYLSLNSLYPAEYFQPGGGHPDTKVSKKIYNYMQEQFNKLFDRNFQSVLELGTGGGEITHHFLANKLDFLAVEGTDAGVARLKESGVPGDKTLQRNLKFLEQLPRRFDLAMCTEVAEHIEPFFASKVVENCVAHSDVVWFSGAKGDHRPHYHHINEVPIAAWDNLFAQFGHKYFVELSGLASRADRIYMNEAAFSKLTLKS